MRVLYVHDNYYALGPDGEIWSPGQFPYAYFTTFLKAFDHIVIVGRGKSSSENVTLYNQSSGPGLSFELFPDMNSPYGLVQHRAGNSRRMAALIDSVDAVIVRACCDLSWVAYLHARRKGKPVAMEMAACAWDATFNHGSLLGKAYAPVRYMHDRIMAANANAVLYVSRDFLQRRYPARGGTAVASNVRIERPGENILNRRLEKIASERPGEPLAIGLIGTVANKLKGVHTALDALQILRKEGDMPPFVFRVLGPGDTQPYEAHAARNGVADRVFFDGILKSGKGVLEWLDGIDIYIQPSFQEGVPRATIEAMSRGCPALGSTVGGIPELLPQERLHKPGDARRLALLLGEMLGDQSLRQSEARRNFKTSLDYASDKLAPIREKFWRDFAEIAAAKMPRE